MTLEVTQLNRGSQGKQRSKQFVVLPLCGVRFQKGKAQRKGKKAGIRRASRSSVKTAFAGPSNQTAEEGLPVPVQEAGSHLLAQEGPGGLECVPLRGPRALISLAAAVAPAHSVSPWPLAPSPC